MPDQIPRARQLIIYCDESEDKGKYFSHFYGGVAVDAKKRERIDRALAVLRDSLVMQGEVKWTKVRPGYEQKYIDLIDSFFDFVERREIKVRIMFLQNMYSARDLDEYQVDNQYFILYYHFIKHAFGLQHCNPARDMDTRVQLLFDELPDNKERCDEFKGFIASLNQYPPFSRNRVSIPAGDIGEIDGKQHVLAQCLDVVLGAMQFRLNDKHLEKPEGARKRGKRTIAKEKVYKHINKRIRAIYPGFNIGVSTGRPEANSTWSHEYRHWRFVPANARVDPTKSKQK